MNQNAKPDANSRFTMLGVTDDASAEIRRILVDPTTGRLKVSAIISSGGAIASINSDSTAAQTLAVGTTGSDFTIVDNGTGTHTFNLPTASHTARGLLSSADWDTFNGKLSTVTAHNLLSATHGDTTAGAVARGSIITGQGVSPTWSALAFPASPTGKVLVATATDVAWSTNPLTIGASASVSGSNTGDQTISDATISLSNIATGNASTTAHGFLLIATAPAAGLTNIVAIENGETVYKNKALFDATAPTTQAFGDAAAVGTAVVSARRDHKHAMMDTPTSVSGNAGTATKLAATKNINGVAFDGSADITIPADWVPLGACTYEGADAPTYTISFASDVTGILGAGMRIKLTDSTVKYFIITGVGAYSGGKTIITVYGGTDYTLSGGAITLPYYSKIKCPFGFPLNPIKWTVEINNGSLNTQASPSASTWYNLDTVSISVPIGVWNVSYQCCAYIVGASGAATNEIRVTLSTANNSQSDNDFSSVQYVTSLNTATTPVVLGSMSRNKTLVIAAKTSYYLNAMTGVAGAGSINISGATTNGSTIIRAVCAYL